MNPLVKHHAYQGQPIVISEYGEGSTREPGFLDIHRAQTELLMEQDHIQGFCYTQFNEQYQETGALVDPDRNPLVDPAEIKAINDSMH